jgi:FAD/FMN-containing dehydrogenase
VIDCVRDVNKIAHDGKTQAVVTFGTGCSAQEMTDALDKSGLFMISAAASTVKPAGGFGLTAGHAPLSSTYGLGADNISELKVVTADGK